MRVDDNKTELFRFLSQQVVKLPIVQGKSIYATEDSGVLSSVTNPDLSGLAPCSHEEADTRLLLHAADAVRKGYRKLCIRTVDTDVLVIAIAMFRKINPDAVIWNWIKLAACTCS